MLIKENKGVILLLFAFYVSLSLFFAFAYNLLIIKKFYLKPLFFYVFWKFFSFSYWFVFRDRNANVFVKFIKQNQGSWVILLNCLNSSDK